MKAIEYNCRTCLRMEVCKYRSALYTVSETFQATYENNKSAFGKEDQKFLDKVNFEFICPHHYQR